MFLPLDIGSEGSTAKTLSSPVTMQADLPNTTIIKGFDNETVANSTIPVSTVTFVNGDETKDYNLSRNLWDVTNYTMDDSKKENKENHHESDEERKEDHDDDDDDDDEEEDEKFCNILAEESESDFYIRLADFIFLFIGPMVVITVLYSLIVARLWCVKVC